MKLFSLMVALIVAGLAVVGGTWATQVGYFDPNVTTPPDGKHYDVDFMYRNRSDEYVEPDGTVENNVFTDRFWCPGRTEVVNLRIKNNEEFPVDVYLKMTVDDVESGELSKVLTAAWIKDSEVKQDSWDNFYTAAGANVSPLKDKDVVELLYGARNTNVIPANQYLDIVLAIHMDESATSEYASQSVDINFVMTVNADYAPGTTPPEITPTPAPAETSAVQ